MLCGLSPVVSVNCAARYPSIIGVAAMVFKRASSTFFWSALRWSLTTAALGASPMKNSSSASFFSSLDREKYSSLIEATSTPLRSTFVEVAIT